MTGSPAPALLRTPTSFGHPDPDHSRFRVLRHVVHRPRIATDRITRISAQWSLMRSPRHLSCIAFVLHLRLIHIQKGLKRGLEGSGAEGALLNQLPHLHGRAQVFVGARSRGLGFTMQ